MSDYSRSPLDALVANQQKGYVGLHIEQGVPVLDRDLNLLHDLVTAVVRSVIIHYVGNGIPAGADGFAIQALPAGQNSQNFRISAGAKPPGMCMVGGIEVTIPTDTTYQGQAGVPPLTTPTNAQPDPRLDTVYLDVSFTEIDGTVDPDLNNGVDVGMETSVRLKPVWVVLVAEGVPVPDAAAGHVHYPLATLQRPRGKDAIDATIITDLRQLHLTVSVIERRLALVERLLLIPSFAGSPNQFNPKFGSPGANITLFGNNFNIGRASVLFGTTTAPIVGTPTSLQIVTTVPSMAAGPVTITVQTDGGAATSVDDFTVLAPPPPAFAASPNQFNPKFGTAGTNVTLFGTNFNIGTVAVKFGTTGAAIVGTPTATQIVTTVPTMAGGAIKITVQTGAGSATSDDSFTIT